MKKKQGFTLAEVLITLSIIGVVSALTAPSLMSSFQKSKVGPSLKKFMNTIETANQHIMMEKGADTLSGALGNSYIASYMGELEKKVKGKYVGPTLRDLNYNIKTPTKANGSTAPTPSYIFQFNDGTSMALDPGVSATAPTGTAQTAAFMGPFSNNAFYYDINGFQNEPNRLGKDLFLFIIDDAGTVVPYGSKISSKIYNIPSWITASDCAPTPSAVREGIVCAGSVIDNDGKVVYKY